MYIIFPIFCIWIFFTSFQNQYDTNAKIKALFVYNFTKYIEWPNEYKTGDFIIGILGESAVVESLQEMAKTKKVFDQNIQVVQYKNTAEIKKCHMLIIPEKEDDKVNECLSKTSSQSTLIVTEKAGLGKIAGINFVIVQSKQKFELNKNNLENRKLKVSSNLLSLAIVVN